MANRRKLSLSKYGISSKRYKELCGFCEQYPEWKDELMYKTNTVKSIKITDLPKGSGPGKATENLAIRRNELQNKCELIERTAEQADPELKDYIIKSVAYEKPFWYLRDILGIPCSERTFFDSRRYFFFLLSENKKK